MSAVLSSRIWLVLGTLLLALVTRTPPCVAQATDEATRIVAVVNNEPITSRDLTERIRLSIVAAGLADDPETRRRLAPQILRGLIDERLQLQEARRLRLEASEAEIDRAFAAVAQRNGLTAEGLAQTLRRMGVDPETYRRQIAAQIAWGKVVERDLRPRVVISREQIEQALAGTSDEELLLSEIVLPVYTADQEGEVMAQAEGLVRSLQREGDFAALARQISAAPSASEGGDLGWVRLELLRPEFRAVVANLPKGSVSSPVRGPEGVYVFLVRDRRQASAVSTAEREAQIRQRLLTEQLQRLADRRLRELRRRAYIDIRG